MTQIEKDTILDFASSDISLDEFYKKLPNYQNDNFILQKYLEAIKLKNKEYLFNTRQKIIRYLTKELKFFILEFLIYHNYDSKKEYQLRKQKYKFIIYIPNVFFRQI